MPHLFTNAGSRHTHPLYKKKSVKAHNESENNLTAGVNGEEKTTAIPKTYDAIKSAAGADMKVKVTPPFGLRPKG